MHYGHNALGRSRGGGWLKLGHGSSRVSPASP